MGLNRKTLRIMSLVMLSVLTLALLTSTIVLAVLNHKKDQTIDGYKNNNNYDFYLTYGTMPTLYATLNAYTNQNPNTYMWFIRGNTISKDYSADFIHYFKTQSNTNANSDVDFFEIRRKVRAIRENNPSAKFHLYCDDLRVMLILEIFVAAGVEFEDLQVTFLSDGTGTYGLYQKMTEEKYVAQASEWENLIKEYQDNRDNPNFQKYSSDQDMVLQEYAFYVSTFSNVNYWVQNPAYLVNTNSETFKTDRQNMHIVKQDPKVMYNTMEPTTRAAYQKVVLANSLVDSDTLFTLNDAVKYFDANLSGRDKDIVLILGTSYDGLAHNQNFIDQTIKFYTPTVKADDATKAIYKSKEYAINADNTITVDGKKLALNEVGVYLFFKGHPAYPANDELQKYFSDNNIVVLPHRTPVETLFWMYDVKVGGYQSTSYLSCEYGQTEFLYGEPTQSAIVQMKDLGFFDTAVIFTEN